MKNSYLSEDILSENKDMEKATLSPLVKDKQYYLIVEAAACFSNFFPMVSPYSPYKYICY
jgi:hypothetical protein